MYYICKKLIMDVKEVRHGNWISSKYTLVPWQVCVDDFRYILENPDNYFGIPLTEAWFFKFDNLDFLLKDNVGYYVLVNNKEKVYVKFVHSLQNLYFCIYGKEAIFKH